MLASISKEIHGKHIAAQDGRIGQVDDVFFDDSHWALRYLVVNTDEWLSGHKVLISPTSLAETQRTDEAISVRLTRDQVRNAPDVTSDLPVSRQFEEAHARHYGYPFYWNGPYLWGETTHPISGTEPVTAAPGSQTSKERVSELREAEQKARESHLRSANEVIGYRIVAADGAIGHVDDFLLDDTDWTIRQMIVDTRNWLPGKHVCVAVDAIREVDWATREVRLRATRDEIKSAPEAP